MAATTLASDLVSNIPVVFGNAEGDTVPPPSGGAAPTVTIDNAAAGTVAIGADNMSVDFTPTQPPFEGSVFSITAVFTRSDGFAITVEGSFEVASEVEPPVTDEVPVSGVFNAAGITTSPLPA